jgi:hypothetical protein
MSAAAKKAINVKSVQGFVNDFAKLYNLELTTQKSVQDKREIEKQLIEQTISELNKYEYKD